MLYIADVGRDTTGDGNIEDDRDYMAALGGEGFDEDTGTVMGDIATEAVTAVGTDKPKATVFTGGARSEPEL